MNTALLSSKNMCWCTPQDFFDKLNAEFGFVLDPAATDKTAKCSLYYTPETDGLSQSWDRGGAHLDSGEKCECREEEIEAKNSQKYACGLTEQDVESGWECPLDNPNETVERCEDCAFAKETD